MKITVCKLERKQHDNGTFWIEATLTNESKQVFGWQQTSVGSKRMLTVRAKQFGLKVSGDIAN